MDQFEHILLFKTNIRTKKHVDKLGQLFGRTTGIADWNLDLQDRDKVLRIESHTLNHQDIITLITAEGHFCCELT